MAIRFRRTVRIAPGVKFNIGKKSASFRVGGKNAGYTFGTRGHTVSASVPGTGLGVTQKLSGSKRRMTDGRQREERQNPLWAKIVGWVAFLAIAAFLIAAFSHH